MIESWSTTFMYVNVNVNFVQAEFGIIEKRNKRNNTLSMLCCVNPEALDTEFNFPCSDIIQCPTTCPRPDINN